MDERSHNTALSWEVTLLLCKIKCFVSVEQDIVHPSSTPSSRALAPTHPHSCRWQRTRQVNLEVKKVQQPGKHVCSAELELEEVNSRCVFTTMWRPVCPSATSTLPCKVQGKGKLARLILSAGKFLPCQVVQKVLYCLTWPLPALGRFSRVLSTGNPQGAEEATDTHY